MPFDVRAQSEAIGLQLDRLGSLSAATLAGAFGWLPDEQEPRSISRGGTVLDVTRCIVSGEPAAVFGTVQSRNGIDPLESLALYGYHAGVDWGLLADDHGLTIFNPHWLSERGWFYLPRLTWAQARRQNELTPGLTADGLVDGLLDRVAPKMTEPTGFLRPVDDALVLRLDRWRDQALSYARDAERVDERLQTLYAQFFVLRTVEDRRLEPSVPPISSILRAGDTYDIQAWQQIIAAARQLIGSDLFDEDVTGAIPEHVVAGVISDLYVPKGLPDVDARYDFSWLEADVLGLAYEKYLATVLNPAPPPLQLEMFQSPQRGVERQSVRKSTGAYYTPSFISGYLSAKCVDDFFADAPTEIPHIVDFACGSGSFLTAAVGRMLKHLKKIDPDRHWARDIVDGGYLVGIDVDEKAVNTARLNLWQRLIEEPGALPLPKLADVIVVADGLRRETWGSHNRSYDIVLGNPPFLAVGQAPDRTYLESTFASAKGRYDFSYLFVEQALNVLVDGGQLGMVIPNRLFKNRNAETIRERLTTLTKIRVLVDFGSTKPFDAAAYVACIVAQKRRLLEPLPGRLRVIQIRSLDADYITRALLDASTDLLDRDTRVLLSYTARHPEGRGPWFLLSERDQRALVLVEDVSVPLHTIAEIPQGIRTGGNDAYLFTIHSYDGSTLCQATNGFGETFIMEIDLLEPVVFGADLRRYEIAGSSNRLLYPYRNNVILPESQLQHFYPNTWSYLQMHRELLSARASLTRSGGKWYGLVWPRDERWLRSPKLLIRDLATRTSFALDATGKIFLVGGTAIVPQQPELLLGLLAYLNSSFVNTLVSRSTPIFGGGFQKFEPQHIQRIPVLNSILEDDTVFQHLGDLALRCIEARQGGNETDSTELEGQIDNIVFEAARRVGVEVG